MRYKIIALERECPGLTHDTVVGYQHAETSGEAIARHIFDAINANPGLRWHASMFKAQAWPVEASDRDLALLVWTELLAIAHGLPFVRAEKFYDHRHGPRFSGRKAGFPGLKLSIQPSDVCDYVHYMIVTTREDELHEEIPQKLTREVAHVEREIAAGTRTRNYEFGPVD